MGLNLPLPRIRNARTRRDHFVQRELGRLQPARSAGVLSFPMDAGQGSALYLRLMAMQVAGKFDSSWTEAQPFARMVNETLKPAA